MMLRRQIATADGSDGAAASVLPTLSRAPTRPSQTKATSARGGIRHGVLLVSLLATTVLIGGFILETRLNSTHLLPAFYSVWRRLLEEVGAGGGRKKRRPVSGPIVDSSSEVTIPLNTDLCPNTVRAGDEGDGGWWLCGADSAVGTDCVVYSFGIRENFSFDHYVAGRGCTVHGFDPSPAGLGSGAAYESILSNGMEGGRAVYHPYGLGNDGTYEPGMVPFRWPGMAYLRESNTNRWTLKSLSNIQNELKNDRITVLKVDVEGCEWDMMMDIVHATWDELCIELHFYPGYFYVFETDSGGMNIIETHHATFRRQRPEQNVRSVNRIQLLKELNKVSDMFLWEPNGDDCVEAYFRRKRR